MNSSLSGKLQEMDTETLVRVVHYANAVLQRTVAPAIPESEATEARHVLSSLSHLDEEAAITTLNSFVRERTQAELPEGHPALKQALQRLLAVPTPG